MIPLKFLLKMGTYEVKIQGVNVKASVIDNACALDVKIAEFKASLRGRDRAVVGVDVRITNVWMYGRIPVVLILFTENCCLIIQLCRFNRNPVSLSNFLKDTNICFVIEKAENLTVGRVWFHKNLNSCLTSVVELSELAARVLKKPNLSTFGLVELASEIGIEVKLAGTKAPNWKSIVFSNEEIKFAILDACTIYRIGYKLLGMVA